MYSPSSINTYLKNPRLYYYRYILKIPSKPSIHLYKGSLIHEIIENAYKSKTYINLATQLPLELSFKWKLPQDLILTKKEEKQHYNDAKSILKQFGQSVERSIKNIMEDSRIKTKQKAWNSFIPINNEEEIIDTELDLKGIIDAVTPIHENGELCIIDYKTSKKINHVFQTDYLRQLILYAILYERKHKKNIDIVGINYLRYGETYFFTLTKEQKQDTLKLFEHIKQKTKSTDTNDYPIEGDFFSTKECREIEQELKLQVKNDRF